MRRWAGLVRGVLVLALATGLSAAAWAALPKLERLAGLAPQNPLGHRMTVHFVADTGTERAWDLRPLQAELKLRLGETGIVFFDARNTSADTQVAQARYRIAPAAAERYFVRVSCFCSGEQQLGPHQNAELPVVFYIDPAIAKDPALRNLRNITLTYAFDRVGEAQKPAHVAAEAVSAPAVRTTMKD